MDQNSISLATKKNEEVEVDLKVKLYGYTMSIILIFLVQIMVCVGIYLYQKMKTANNKKLFAKNEAEFYQFFYTYHKMFPDDEGIKELANKKDQDWKKFLAEYKRQNP